LSALAPDIIPTPPRPSGGGLRGFLRAAVSIIDLRKTPYGLRPAIVLAVVTLVQILDSQVFNIAGPDIARDLRINIGQIFGVLYIIGIITILAALFAGWWADRHRRVPFAGIATIVSGLAAIVSSGTHGPSALATARSVDESGTQGTDVPLFSLLADYYPPETRARAFSAFSTVRRAGAVGAVLLGGVLITRFGWRPTFVGIGVALILAGLLPFLLLREPIRGYFERKAHGADEEQARVEDEPQSFGEAWRATWSVRTIRRLFLAGIWDSADVPYGVLLPFFLAEFYGLNALDRGLVILPSAIAALVGGVMGTGVIDQLSRRAPAQVLRATAVLGVFSTIGIGIVAFELPIWIFATFNAFAAFAFAIVRPTISSIYSQVIPPSIRTQGLQITNLPDLAGIIIGIPTIGAIQQQFGYQAAFLSIAPLFLVGALIRVTAADFFEVDRRNALTAAGAGQEWKRARAEGTGKLLVCRGVDVEYDGAQVLFGVDFDVDEGEIIALLGTNGAGKSTLLRAISGTQEASSGAIVFDGREITHMPPHEVARRGIVHMPGGRGTFPELTVRENLELGTWMLDDASEAHQRLASVYELFPILRDRGDMLAGALSGGEQQMLSLSQAFLAKPRLLMIDELSLGLSPAVVEQLLEIVRQFHAQGTTIIVVEQSVSVALTIARRAIFMEKGEVRFVGDTADLLRRPDILRAVYVKGTTGLAAASLDAAARRRREEELSRLDNVLAVEQVIKTFGGIRAVDGVSLNLRQGEVLGIIGPNGSGKTTLFDIISGYVQPDSGVIRYEGVDITNLPPHERARRKLIRRFQDARLFPSLTVYEAILVALDQRLEVKNTFLSAAAVPQARRAERRARVRADRLIELLELGAFRDKFVRELSTGLRRITDLAFVLATEPKVLLLDEPSSGIAQAESESLAPLLLRVKYETGCSVLIIEHDMPLITAVSDELIALDLGQVLTRGSATDVLNDPRVIESYLGGTEADMQAAGSIAR
jgi:branched-chain amino acid transport system ATP-binding protein